MLLIIIFGAIALIGVGITLYGCLELKKKVRYIYDEKGKEEVYGYDIYKYRDLELDRTQKYKCRKVTKRYLQTCGCYDRKDEFFIPGLCTAIVLGIALLISGICAIVPNTRINKAENLIWYEVKIEELQDREQTIRNCLKGDYNITYTVQEGTYHVIVDQPLEIKKTIDEYNRDVRELKKNVYMTKVHLESPWLNWYTCPAIKDIESYNPDAKSYKEILGDTLKIFELETK